MSPPAPSDRTAAVVTTVIFALTFSGCSDAEPRPRPAASEEAFARTQLEQMLADIYGTQDQAIFEEMLAEELIAECMAGFGFQYLPRDLADDPSPPQDPGVEPNTREFTELYGYGVTTDPFGAADDPPYDPAQYDPNWDHVMAMSENEKRQYSDALHGSGGSAWDDWENQGCQGWAYHEAQHPAPGVEDSVITALEDELQIMGESIPSDPRVAAAVVAWASCMADRGHPGFTEISEPYDFMWGEFDRVWAETHAGLPGDASQSEEQAARASAFAAVTELTPLEIDMALADFDCRAEVGYDLIWRQVEVEYQQEFYDAHRTELEAWRDAVVEARANR